MRDGRDVRLLQRIHAGVHGILAAPDCTNLAGSGARWWAAKGEGALVTALSLVDACVRIAWVQQPLWWALENPVGRLRRYLGPPRMTFDPADYGGSLHETDAALGRVYVSAEAPYRGHRRLEDAPAATLCGSEDVAKCDAGWLCPGIPTK